MTPAPIKRNLESDNLSDIPTNPTRMDVKKTVGPIIANAAFTPIAFSMELSLSINIAALISIKPEKIRNITMTIKANSIEINQDFIYSPLIRSIRLYKTLCRKGRVKNKNEQQIQQWPFDTFIKRPPHSLS